MEDFVTTSSQYSIITSSSSSFGEPLSTVNPANSTEILSDFHEAKISSQQDSVKYDPLSKEGGSIQDSNSNNGLETSASFSSAEESSGLNNVQTAVLSACGVLVVGGIAVGIFVWKNTYENKTPGALASDNQDNGHFNLNRQFSLEKYHSHVQQKKQRKQSMKEATSEKNEQDDTMQDISNRVHYQTEYNPDISIALPTLEQEKENFFSIGSNFLKESTIFSDIHQSSKTDKTLLLANLEEGLFSFEDFNTPHLPKPEENSVAINVPQTETDQPALQPIRENNRVPSAEDPQYDPTALTYSLRKFLQTPVLQQSPIHISIDLGIDDDDEEEEEKQ